MEKVLQCDCGFAARAEHEDGLAAAVQRYAWEAHRMTLTPDQALLLASRAELDATAPSCKPDGKPLHDPSQTDRSDQEEEEE